MMKIIEQAKNGQVTNGIKTYDELTDQEKANLSIPRTEELSDFANFQVRYNKLGDLLGVEIHDFSQSKLDKMAKDSHRPDLIDGMKVLYGSDYEAGRARARIDRTIGSKGPSVKQIRKAAKRLGKWGL